MPRFYLHIRSGPDFIEDEEGMELPDLAAARKEAIRGARGLMSAEVLDGSLTLDQSIEIHAGEIHAGEIHAGENPAGEAKVGEAESGDVPADTLRHIATVNFAEVLRVVDAEHGLQNPDKEP